MDSAVGDIATAKELLRTSLANCTAFRTWDGNDWTVDQAKARIYLDSLPPPARDSQDYTLAELEAYHPFAIVAEPDFDQQVRWMASASNFDAFVCSGVLLVMFFRTVPDDVLDDLPSAQREMDNFIGQLVRSNDRNSPGLLELSGQAGYLRIYEIASTYSSFTHPDERPAIGDEQRHGLVVRWGLTQ